MLTNKDLVDVFLNSKRNKARLIQLVSATLAESEEVVRDIIEKWTKRFLTRWDKVRNRESFLKNERAWLESDFQVSKFLPFSLRRL